MTDPISRAPSDQTRLVTQLRSQTPQPEKADAPTAPVVPAKPVKVAWVAGNQAGKMSTNATVDSDGLVSATAGLSAMKQLKVLQDKGLIDVSADGTISVKRDDKGNYRVDSAQVAGLAKLVSGQDMVVVNGKVKFANNKYQSADFNAKFAKAWGSTSLSGSGELTLAAGKPPSAKADISALFDNQQLSASTNLQFNTDANSAQVEAKFKTAGLSGDGTATIEADRLVSATAGLSAMKQLKVLQGNGAIDVSADGTISIKRDPQGRLLVDAAQVTGLAKLVSGQDMIEVNGKVAFADGSYAGADFNTKFSKAWKSTTVSGTGELTLAPGQPPSAKGDVSALFNNEKLSASGNLQFDTAAKSAAVAAKFKAAGLSGDGTATVDADGLVSATAGLSAMKQLKVLQGQGDLTVSADGTVSVKRGPDGKYVVDAAQVTGLMKLVSGQDMSLDAGGTVKFADNKFQSVDFNTKFSKAWKSTTVSGTGELTLAPGQPPSAKGDVSALFNNEKLSASGNLQFDTAAKSAAVAAKFKAAGLSGDGTATLDADGLVSATAGLSAMKQLKVLQGRGDLTVSADGTVSVKRGPDGKYVVDAAQVTGLMKLVSGQDMSLDAGGTVKFADNKFQSADFNTKFSKAWKSTTVSGTGELTLAPGQPPSAKGDISALFNNEKMSASGNLQFDTAAKSAAVAAKFQAAGLSGDGTATLDGDGLASATAGLSAMKQLKVLQGRGDLTVSADGTVSVKRGPDGKYVVDAAQVTGLMKLVSGQEMSLDAGGTVKFADNKFQSAEFNTKFSKAWKSTTLSTEGSLVLAPGQPPSAKGEISALFNNEKLSASTDLQFDTAAKTAQVAAKFKSAGLPFDPTGSVEGSVTATINERGVADAAVSLAALTRLKQLGKDGAIDIKTDGTVVIKDNKIDRAEVSALITAMSGQNVNLSTEGKLVYQDGHFDPSFAGNLGATWGATQLNANGRLTVVDGRPEVTGKVNAMFGGANAKAGATLEVTGVDSGTLNLSLAKLGGTNKIDASGGLVVDHGRISGANFTTNLVTGGENPANIGLNGLVSINDQQAAASINTSVKAGVFNGSLGVGTNSTVQEYTPSQASDPARKAIADSGGVWSERTSTFNLAGSAGASTPPIQVGPAQVSLGFTADGKKNRTVQTLTVHPNKTDALARPAVMVTNTPRTSADVLKMHPYEQVTESGNQAVGLSGNVNVGFGAGPASISAGGSMYYQVTGNMTRDIQRLDGDKVRVRFRVGDGSTDVKALTASVGLNASKVPLPKDLADKAGPILEQVAQAGIKASWTDLKHNDTALDVTIDLSTPQGRAAMDHLLNNDASEAQYWAGFSDSGVKLKSLVATQVHAQTKDVDMHIGTINHDNVARFLEAQKKSMTPAKFAIDQAVDNTLIDKPWFPWNATQTIDVRFVHEEARKNDVLPSVSTAPTPSGAMTAHFAQALQPARGLTIADSKAALGVHIRSESAKTSSDAMLNRVDPTLNTLQALGVGSSALTRISSFRNVTANGVQPRDNPIVPLINLGDNKYGATSVDFEGYVSPQGFPNIFTPQGKVSSAGDFAASYIEMDAIQNGGSDSVLTQAGLRARLESELDAQLVPASNGSFDVKQGTKKLGNLTQADLNKVQLDLLDYHHTGRGGQGHPDKVIAPVGTWVGKPPNPLLTVKGKEMANSANTPLLIKAHMFGYHMGQASELYRANQPPEKKAGETDKAFQARTEQWKKTSLFEKPEEYFRKMDEIFGAALKEKDVGAVPGLALLKMAGSDTIFARAQVDIPKEQIKDIVNGGRANVQRFGATALLARMGAKISGNNLVLPASTDPSLATAAAKALFGEGVTASKVGTSLSLSGLEFPSASYKDDLTSLLSWEKGDLTIPPHWTGQQIQDVLGELFGSTAVVKDGKIVFDNRDYGFVHFGDALGSAFGPKAFGAHAINVAPPNFPTLVPIERESNQQSYNDLDDAGFRSGSAHTGLTAVHQGKNARFAVGSNFGNLDKLRADVQGHATDLSQLNAGKSPTDWILR